MADDDIISGGLDIVTDKTKKIPKAEQETAQPTAARFDYADPYSGILSDALLTLYPLRQTAHFSKLANKDTLPVNNIPFESL